MVTSGFEMNDTTIVGESAFATGPTPTLTTSPVRSGTYALSNGGFSWEWTGAHGTTYYWRSYLYVIQTPAADRNLGYFTTAGSSTGLIRPVLNTSNQVTLAAPAGASGSSAALSTGRWYRIEMAAETSASASSSYYELRVDGITISTSSTWNQTTALGRANVQSGNVAGDIVSDDFALNDSSGSAQNSWVGDSAIVLLLPTADSAVGTGWTLGTGTAISSNGFGSVDNTPPIGVADLAAGSDPKQIRNAASAANSNYDATMTTYSAAGIGAGSTINVVDPIVITAAPTATQAKQGTVGVVSNPAITNIALAAAGTSGAFWQGNAATTYTSSPSGWKISHGTVTYAPAVTLGTAPVMRITQVTSSTRIAMVCFLGIYVDFTAPQPLPILVTQVGTGSSV